MTVDEAIDALLIEFSVGDHIYKVRDRAAEKNDGFTGNLWNHPDVVRYSEAIVALQNRNKEGKV